MRVTVFSAKAYEKGFFEDANRGAGGAPKHELKWLEARLDAGTASLAAGADAVCLFVLDRVDAAAADALAAAGVRAIALRCAGFNNIDVKACESRGLSVVRVPAYSPYAVAEHAVGLLMTVNRKLHRAISRTREHNFALDGLMGFDLHGKTVGVVGMGRIGQAFARILLGFGCRVLASDPAPSAEARTLAVEWCDVGRVVREADVIALHCPLTPGTRHLIDASAVASMKPGVVLINTSRGAVVDTSALIAGLKTGRIGGVGLDVYEEEDRHFFRDLSDAPMQDDVLARLLTFPNVVMTAHQGFFTREALANIAATTVRNLDLLALGTVDEENVVVRAGAAAAAAR